MCISNIQQPTTSTSGGSSELDNEAAQLSNNASAFVLSAADEQDVDTDALEQLQQQIRTKHRLT